MFAQRTGHVVWPLLGKKETRSRKFGDPLCPWNSVAEPRLSANFAGALRLLPLVNAKKIVHKIRNPRIKLCLVRSSMRLSVLVQFGSRCHGRLLRSGTGGKKLQRERCHAVHVAPS
jgi:hypothetical protein